MEKKLSPNSYEKIRSTLIEFNQFWSKNVPLLIITIAHTKYTYKEKDNYHAFYDLGQSVGNLSLQATYMGLYLHQMGGFDADKAKEIFALPENYVAVSAIAVGYIGSLDELSEELRKIEEEPRSRKELSDIVFTEKFGIPFK